MTRLHRAEVVLGEGREDVGAGRHRGRDDLVDAIHVLVQGLAGESLALHLERDEDVRTPTEDVRHLLEGRHMLAALLQGEVRDGGKGESLHVARSGRRRGDGVVVHDHEPAIGRHLDVRLESGHTRVKRLQEASQGIVVVLKVAAMRHNARRLDGSYQSGHCQNQQGKS